MSPGIIGPVLIPARGHAGGLEVEASLGPEVAETLAEWLEETKEKSVLISLLNIVVIGGSPTNASFHLQHFSDASAHG